MLDFSAYIADRTKDFTGRVWVFREIDTWLADRSAPRTFLITGNPGSGKTAISARLVQFSEHAVHPPDGLARLSQDFLSARHFCSIRDRRWINPYVFVESVALQLAARYSSFARALAERSGDRQIRIEVEQRAQVVSGQMAGVVIHNLEVGSLPVEDAFVKVVREPLETLLREQPQEQLVILIDGLDEALLYSGEVGIVELLAGVEGIPENVRFILTSRRDEDVENKFLAATGLFLSAEQYKEATRNDIGRYIETRCREVASLAAQVAGLTVPQREAVVAAIVTAAGGNFLYARFLSEEIARGQRSLGDVGGLPRGLDALYYESLSRIVKPGSPAWTAAYAPLLGVFSVAQESLILSQLMAFTGESEAALWERLGAVQQFITEESAAGVEGEAEARYRLYHQSVVDFLRRPFLQLEGKRLRNGFYLLPEPWHRLIADYYWQTYSGDWSQCDRYGLNNLAMHLHAGGETGRLSELISKEWMFARHRGGSYSFAGFLGDVNLSLTAALATASPGGQPDLRILIQMHAARHIVNTQVGLYTDADLHTLTWLGRKQEALAHARLRARTKDRFKGLFAVYLASEEMGSPDLVVYSEVGHLLEQLISEPERRTKVGIFDIPVDPERRPLVGDFLAHFPAVPEHRKTDEGLADRTWALGHGVEDWFLARDLTKFASRLHDCGRDDLVLLVAEQTLHVIDARWAPEERAESLADLALVLERSGHHKLAARVWIKSERLIRSLATFPAIQAEFLRRLTQNLASAGHRRRATELLTRIEQSTLSTTFQFVDKWMAACWLAVAWAGVGENARALDLFARIERVLRWAREGSHDPQWDGVALSQNSLEDELAYTLAQAGFLTLATEHVRNVSEDEVVKPKHRKETLVTLAQLASREGQAEILDLILEETHKAVHDVSTSPDDQMPDEEIHSLSTWDRMCDNLLRAFVQAGRSADAERLAGTYEDADLHARYLSMLAHHLAAASCAQQAERLMAAAQLEAMREEGMRDWNAVLVWLVEAAVQASCFSAARKITGQIHRRSYAERLEALSAVARGLARAGRTEEADALLVEAVQIMNGWSDGEGWNYHAKALLKVIIEARRYRGIEDLVQLVTDGTPNKEEWDPPMLDALVETNQLQMAIPLARSLLGGAYCGDSRRLAGSVRNLVEQLIAGNRIPEAYDLLKVSRDVRLKADSLARLVVALYRAGEGEQANQLLDELREIVEQLHGGPWRFDKPVLLAEALIPLVVALYETGHQDEALRAFGKTEDAILAIDQEFLLRDQMSLLIGLLGAIMKTGQVEHGLAWMEQITRIVRQYQDDHKRDEVLHNAALVLARAGYFAAAYRIIDDQIGRADWRQEAQAGMLYELVRWKSLDLALEMAHKMPSTPDKWLRARTLVMLATHLGDAGRFQEAYDLIFWMEDEEYQSAVRLPLARASMQAKRFEEAFGLMDTTSLEYFIGFLAESAAIFEQVEPDLSLVVLRMASSVAAWVRPDWGEVHDILSSS